MQKKHTRQISPDEVAGGGLALTKELRVTCEKMAPKLKIQTLKDCLCYHIYGAQLDKP